MCAQPCKVALISLRSIVADSATSLGLLPALTLCVYFVYPTLVSAQIRDHVSSTPLLIAEGITEQISDSVYVIPDESRRFVPNIGIIVGSNATLVIDAGLGTRNGEIVRRKVIELSASEDLYLISTHYHGEHSLGLAAFPDESVLIRSRDQQLEIDAVGASHVERLSQLSPSISLLLDGAEFGAADVLFDDEYYLDLGGITASIYAVGPAHTRGDTVVFVEEERVLFSGDVAMQRYPMFASPASGVAVWREALATIGRLQSRIVVPSHGAMGNMDVIRASDRFFELIQQRVAEIDGQGGTLSDEIVQMVANGVMAKFYKWDSQGAEQRINPIIRAAYLESK